MLKGFQLSSPRFAIRLRVVVAGVLLIGCGWIGCWNVQAQTTGTLQEQEGVRVAAAEPKPAAVAAPFSKPVSAPWTDFGGQSGYVSMRVGALMEHPLARPLVNTLLEDSGMFRVKEDGTTPCIADFGLQAENIVRIDGVLITYVQPIPENEQDESGETRKAGFSVGSGGAIIETDTDVNWPELVRSINIEAMTNSPETKTAFELLANKVSPGKRLVVSTTKPGSKERPLPTRRQQLMWNAVAGGVITGFSLQDEESAKTGFLNPDAEMSECKKALQTSIGQLYEQLGSLAIGADFLPGDEGELIFRITFEPKSGQTVDDIHKAAETLRENLIASVNEKVAGDDSAVGKTWPPDMTQRLSEITLTTVGTGDEAFVLVSGQFDIASLCGN